MLRLWGGEGRKGANSCECHHGRGIWLASLWGGEKAAAAILKPRKEKGFARSEGVHEMRGNHNTHSGKDNEVSLTPGKSFG